MRTGQVLSFDFLRRDARAYVAVAGGIDVPPVLGSRSTYVLGALGGLEGRALQAGDTLPVGVPQQPAVEGRTVPESLRQPAAPGTLRVLPGLYWYRLTASAHESFFADTWKVAPEADRIGYRFRGGRPLDFVPRAPPFGAVSDPSNIVGSGYPYGPVQVPGGTEPIVLRRDAVSGGGYFMLGAVVSADMDLIGQMQPHTPTCLAMVDMSQALAARAARLRQIREALRAS